jgi:hypothetical protein
MNRRYIKGERGAFVLLMLVFSSIFLGLVSTLGSLIIVQQRLALAKQNREQAFRIAETGLEYYKWFLAHFPGDLQNGTGVPGPYVMDVSDPEAGVIGSYSLSVSGETQCGITSSIEIESVGQTVTDPSFKRTLVGKYARPSVAEYAYILNSNVWAGADRVISGPYHSNGGIRMDGSINSTISSGVSTWLCTSSFGCSPSSNQNGVFGAGNNQQLWTYPIPQVDFNGISVDLSNLKTYAVSDGLYFAPSGNYGYHVTFLNDGSIDVYRVTGTTQVWGYTTEFGWVQERPVISSQTFVGNYAVPASCSVVFVEDNLWVDGVVSGRKTIVAADVTTPNVDRNVWLPSNLVYVADDGEHGLTVIGENNVLVGLNTPDTMDLRGVYIAQKGRFGRNHYCQTDCSGTSGDQGLPSSLDPYVLRTQLTLIGSIVSNGREGTKWSSGGVAISGYQARINAYDRKLATDPPPLTPYTSSDYRFIEWREN